MLKLEYEKEEEIDSKTCYHSIRFTAGCRSLPGFPNLYR